jgi:hypothetical protein
LPHFLAVGHRTAAVILSSNKPRAETGMNQLILAGAELLAAQDARSVWVPALWRMFS